MTIRIFVSNVKEKTDDLGQTFFSHDIYLGDENNPSVYLTIPNHLYSETMTPIIQSLIVERSYEWEYGEETVPQTCVDQSKGKEEKNNVIPIDENKNNK